MKTFSQHSEDDRQIGREEKQSAWLHTELNLGTTVACLDLWLRLFALDVTETDLAASQYIYDVLFELLFFIYKHMFKGSKSLVKYRKDCMDSKLQEKDFPANMYVLISHVILSVGI